MTISISLTPDQESQLEELARQNGKDPSVYVNDVVTAYPERSPGRRGRKHSKRSWLPSGRAGDRVA